MKETFYFSYGIMPLNRILQKKKSRKVFEWCVYLSFSSSLGIFLNLLGEEYEMIFKS